MRWAAVGDCVFGMADLGLRDRFQSRQQRVRILVSELAKLPLGGELFGDVEGVEDVSTM